MILVNVRSCLGWRELRSLSASNQTVLVSYENIRRKTRDLAGTYLETALIEYFLNPKSMFPFSGICIVFFGVTITTAATSVSCSKTPSTEKTSPAIPFSRSAQRQRSYRTRNDGNGHYTRPIWRIKNAVYRQRRHLTKAFQKEKNMTLHESLKVHCWKDKRTETGVVD